MNNINKNKILIATILSIFTAIPLLPTKAEAVNEIVNPSCSFARVAYALGDTSFLKLGNGYWPSTTKQPIDPLKKDLRYRIDWLGDGSQIELYPTSGYVKSYDPATQTPAEPQVNHIYSTTGKITPKIRVESIDGRMTNWISCVPGVEIYNKPTMAMNITPNPVGKGTAATISWSSQYADRGCYVGTTPEDTGLGVWDATHKIFTVNKSGNTTIYLDEPLNGTKTTGVVNADTVYYGICKSKYDATLVSRVKLTTINLAPPTITWNPPSANINYGDTLKFGYTTSGATSCTAKNIKEGSNVVNNYIDISNNPLQQNWTGIYYADFTRRVECQNAAGVFAVSDLVVTVKQPPILGVSNTDTGGNVIPGNIISLSFGNYTIGEPAIKKTIAVVNKGGGTLTGSLSIPSSAFTCTSGCNFNLASGGVQKVTLEFKVNTKGAQSANASVGSNASNLSLQLFGNAVERYTADTSLDFGDVAIGKSKYLTLTIKDNSPALPGSSPISITSSSAFFTCDKTCNIAVPNGGEAKMRIKFTPKDIQPYLGTLNFNSVVVPTTGNGVKPVFNVQEK